MELRQILDLTPLVIGVFGPNREPLYANRITLDYLGLSLDEWRLGSLASNVILMIWNGSTLLRNVLCQRVLLSGWWCGYRKRMEVIAGFWFAITRCATTMERSLSLVCCCDRHS